MTDGEQEQFNTMDDTDINGLITVPAEQARAESDGGLSPGRPLAPSSLVALTACGGGGGGTTTSPGAVSNVTFGTPGAEPARPTVDARPTAQDAARFLTQASFGAKSVDDIEA